MLKWIFTQRKGEANPRDFERTLCLYYLPMLHSLKEPFRPYTSRILYGVPKIIFARGRGGAHWKGGGGGLLQILSLRRGANSKWGAYWKQGAYSSIYGIWASHKIVK